ncbi:MAG TPA: ATP-dependent DNA helicase RecG, partial [Bacteroidota bacterium]|nr:ATP-dependent DNA helicase RecG [Bacteroidota bacterium]
MKSLSSEIKYVKGVGPRRAEALNAAGIRSVRDLLYYFPRGYLDLSKVVKIAALRSWVNNGQWVTITGTVRSFDVQGRQPKQRFVLYLEDE